jgi:exodeoxyribonuclease VII small subunit
MGNQDYTIAFQELQELVQQIEEGDISVDDLAEKVKKAAELIKICKTKLRSTEEDVNRILQELETAPPATATDITK